MKTSALTRSSQCVTGGLKNGHAEVHFTIFSHKLLDSEAITLLQKANRLAWHTQSRLGWQYVTVPDKRDHFRQNKKVTYFTEIKIRLIIFHINAQSLSEEPSLHHYSVLNVVR